METDSARLLAADIPIVRAPMTGVHVSHDILVAAPAATVWGVTADVSAWPSWSPTVTSVEKRGDGPLTEGMIVDLKQPFQPARSWIVLHCEAPHALILGTVEGDMVARHQIATTSRGTVNRLTLDYAGPFQKLRRTALRMALSMENSGLKRRCEAGGTFEVRRFT
jgi:hypothetical protein